MNIPNPYKKRIIKKKISIPDRYKLQLLKHSATWKTLLLLGRFPFVRTSRPNHGRTSQIENEIRFFKEFLLKTFSFLNIT